MVDGRQRMNDRPCLYYKLDNEPKGSGELKKKKKNSPKSVLNAYFHIKFTSNM